MKILSFDASSTTIAFSLLETEPQLQVIHQDFIKPCKNGTLLQRLKKTKEELLDKLKNWPIPDRVVIEDILLFMKNGSSAQTITVLATFNRMVGLAMFELYGIEPMMLPVITIRSKLKIDKVTPSKEQVPEFLEKHIPGYSFPWILKMQGRGKNKAERPIEENYDMADAIAAGLAGYYILTVPSKQPKASRKSKSKRNDAEN